MASAERDFGVKTQNLGTVIIDAINEASDVDAMWGDGMDVSLSDADVVDLNITKADVTAFITLCQQLVNFANNASVTQGDYRKTLNDVRKIV